MWGVVLQCVLAVAMAQAGSDGPAIYTSNGVLYLEGLYIRDGFNSYNSNSRIIKCSQYNKHYYYSSGNRSNHTMILMLPIILINTTWMQVRPMRC